MRRSKLTPDTIHRHGAIVIADQSGFTRNVLTHGPEVALEQIWEIRRTLIPLFRDFGGEVYKVFADNVYVFFDSVDTAAEASDAAHRKLASVSRKRKVAIRISAGIGFGDLLYLPSEDDYYGAEVNLASKLGEDIGDGGQTLLTDAAVSALTVPGRVSRKRSLVISGVRVTYCLWEGSQ